MKDFCPDTCPHLNLTEAQQRKIKREQGRYEPHVCKKYHRNLFHLGHFTILLRCHDCKVNTFETEDRNRSFFPY